MDCCLCCGAIKYGCLHLCVKKYVNVLLWLLLIKRSLLTGGICWLTKARASWRILDSLIILASFSSSMIRQFGNSLLPNL